ncbi:GFA family protein [Shewanella sp. UCD-KL12]|uniref:GFA family protein n=1 Tax=Shewanella sp. UCD-KL12 TaxID=1917163 RepID=UPI0009702CC4|nr:GFA family protein [Shewanella sp. UCD-KL12]
MHQGSCLCGKIRFQIESEPVAVSNCHCNMCQKQHGAAFATYARFKRSQVNYLSGEASLAVYQSSDNVQRKFCADCGANIEWGYSSGEYAIWVAMALGLFDTEIVPETVKELHEETQVSWWKAASEMS